MENIAQQIKIAVKNLFEIDIDPIVTPAPENMDADFASNVAMQLAGRLKKNPFEIAEAISGQISSEYNVEIARPGFLNFSASDEYWKGILSNYSGNFAENISCDAYLDKTVICEFSDPNPFKVLHVGHLYTSMVGDSIAKLVEFAGGRVVRANFGGDVGLHVAKTLFALEKSLDELKNMPENADRINEIAKSYVEGTRAYEDDEVAKSRITEINKEIYSIAKILNDANKIDAQDFPMELFAESDNAELAEKYFWGRKWSYQYFADFYAKIGVKFDKYYPESTVAGKGMEVVKNALNSGVYQMSDGAVVFHGEDYDLHTRVFINKEGLPTYETKDIGLLFTKWDDYKFDKSIVITGNDIIDYMKVVLKSVEQYAPELVERTIHMTHGNVRLPGNEKMSSRKGNFIKAVDVLADVSNALKNEYNSDDFMIAMAAAKYTFLKYKIGGNIEFNVKDSVSMTGNSGPYLLYSTVRAKKILENKTEESADFSGWNLNESEKKLIKKIAQYKNILSEAVNDLAPHKVCGYLYELAQEFSRFYENVKVAGEPEEKERMVLVETYKTIMEHGLGILGISVPERM